MTAPLAIMLAIAVCAAGAVVCLLLARRSRAAGWAAFLAAAASSLLVLYAAATVLVTGPQPPQTFVVLPQLGSALRMHVDGLSAIFLALVAAIAVLASLYSISYMPHYTEYGVARYYPYLLLFVGGMYGILTTTDLMVFFFAFWQLMTLPSYALIRYEYKKPAHVRAANRYLLMMEAGCALVMIAAALLARGGGPAVIGGEPARYDFAAIGAVLPALLRDHGWLVAGAFAFFLVGFGIKAGMWPFGQLWLPDAHPAAPSPVSALLSGVMIKTGVYGLMRTFIWLVPPDGMAFYPAGAWGGVIATLGAITLFVGTMQALAQTQTKRLLAFHSIGQMGYILLGLGAAVTLLGRGGVGGDVIALGAIGMYGALFHTVNHGMFKSLLFLNAGSMLHATGTQDLNRLGGLMRFMPLTAATTLIASLSIAGVPPFNGFASKWTIYVAAILGSAQGGYLAVYTVIAILTSALTLASFMKFFGASFLSRTSALVAWQAARGSLEVDWLMQLPQVLLAGLCVAAGILPSLAYRVFQAALAQDGQGLVASLAAGVAEVSAGGLPLVRLELANGLAVLAPLLLAVTLGVLLLAAHLISRIGAAQRRSAEAWLCGYAREAEAHRYAAHHLYFDLTRHFRWLGGVPREPMPAGVRRSGEPAGRRHGD